jgi:hypothetical protein
MKKHVISEQALASHWHMTTRRVRQLKEEGVAVRSGAGFDLVESDKRLIAWLRRDEETRRMKRRLLAQQAIVTERKLERSDRELLTIREVRDFLGQAWERMWLSHSFIATHVYNAVRSLPDDRGRAIAFDIEQKAKGELLLLREAFDAITKAAMAKLSCEMRNGIFRLDRRAALLQAEYGTAADGAGDGDEHHGLN